MLLNAMGWISEMYVCLLKKERERERWPADVSAMLGYSWYKAHSYQTSVNNTNPMTEQYRKENLLLLLWHSREKKKSYSKSYVQ